MSDYFDRLSMAEPEESENESSIEFVANGDFEQKLEEAQANAGLEIFGTVTVKQAPAPPLNVDVTYKGYFRAQCTEKELANVYQHLGCNIVQGHELILNEYLILENEAGVVIDVRKWDGQMLVDVAPVPVRSVSRGVTKPFDEIQRCAFDSIQENDVTVLYGKAGCGKTHIPLEHILQWLEKGIRDKLYVVYSYEPMRGAKTLGFEKGDHTDKVLMTGSIGNILATKLGSMDEVLRLIADDQLEIIPTANIRGVEFREKSVVLVTEAQNLDTYTLKTIVQRCQRGTKQIYEGDILEQTDATLSNSGMARLIEVFKGNPSFGCIKLHQSYRSPLCELADRL